MSEFISNTYRAIDIIDGTDVQDSNLYNWLTENATQYNPASYCLINTNKYIARAHWGTSNISKMYLGEYNIFKSLPLLYTPTISLSGANLTIFTTDDNTYYFDIYANGTKVESIETPDGFEVTISFTNGSDTNKWLSTKIYNNYSASTVSDYEANAYIDSEDQIGSIASADGSTTVTTTTGKIFIYGKSQVRTLITGSITTSSGIETEGTADGATSGTGTLKWCRRVYLDGTQDSDKYALLYAFNVTTDGTITIDRAGWYD